MPGHVLSVFYLQLSASSRCTPRAGWVRALIERGRQESGGLGLTVGRSASLDAAREPRPYDPASVDEIVAERDSWQLIAPNRGPDEPDEPKTGLEWGWEMVNCIAFGDMWSDDYASEEERQARFAPTIDRLELLELLAERAPNDDSAGSLGADALEDYLAHQPDVDRVENAAQRSERVRVALAGAWYDSKLPPEDAARLATFSDST